MAKQYIEFTIVHQKITRTDDFFVVGGNKNYLYAKFTFCEDWEGENIIAVFTAGEIIKRIPLVDGECQVPWEVMQPGIRKFYVGCFAGSRITSNAARVDVEPCGACDADGGLAPTPDVYIQLLAIAQEAQDVANSVREDADNGVFDGPMGPPGEKGEKGEQGEKGEKGDPGPSGEPETIDYSVYFDIDYDGLVSLKDVYRGFGLAGTNAPYCVSNNGIGFEGSKISELPERLVVPQNIDGENVTGFQVGAFAYNHKIKEVVLPSNVKTIPSGLFRESLYLKKVENTEQIESIGPYAFHKTSIKEIRFPNLKELKSYAFQNCSLLRLIDIGQITVINQKEFEFCEDLAEVLGGENVTQIKIRAFFGTRRLKNLPFLSNVTEVQAEAFFGSRCDFEEVYDAMVGKGCTFKDAATYKQYNSTNYWSNVKPTPCKVPLNSLFHQKDPRWADHTIADSKDENGNPCTFAKNGCAFITLAEIYSALENVHFNSPEEFVPILESKGLMDLDYRYKDGWIQIANGLGYETEYISKMTSENLTKVYTALEQGALIYRSVGTGKDSPYGGHATLCYGVNTDGELLMSDTAQKRSDLGVYENHKSASAIYTHGSEECDVVIVKKGE